MQLGTGESKLLLFETFWFYFFLLERFLEELTLLKIALGVNLHTSALSWVYIFIPQPCPGCKFSHITSAKGLSIAEKQIETQCSSDNLQEGVKVNYENVHQGQDKRMRVEYRKFYI